MRRLNGGQGSDMIGKYITMKCIRLLALLVLYQFKVNFDKGCEHPLAFIGDAF